VASDDCTQKVEKFKAEQVLVFAAAATLNIEMINFLLRGFH
jgi:hypothetical protein